MPVREYYNHPLKLKLKFLKTRFFCEIKKRLPEYTYPFILSLYYKIELKRKLNLKNPQTLTEKIQYLKLHDNIPQKGVLTDKLKAKDYVASILPDLKIAKVYDIAKSFEKLDFSKCPDSFLLKTNHACKNTIYIPDKEEFQNNKKKIRQISKYYKEQLSLNYAFWHGIEPQYKDIEPKIFVEEYINPKDERHYHEYFVWCFNGEVQFIEDYMPTFEDRQKLQGLYGVCVFNTKWERVPFSFFPYWDKEVPKPNNLERIIEYAKILSSDFKFVRVDFLATGGELYFGEMTFTPTSGLLNIKIEEDIEYGKRLKIQ